MNGLKNPLNMKKSSRAPGGWGRFSNQILTVLLIFMMIAAAYTLLFDLGQKGEEIPISQLAADVSSGLISKLVIENNKVEATYQSGEVKFAKKEPDISLSETLVSYGVTPVMLSGVAVEVKTESGFSFWFLNLLPFLVPVIFILLFFWLISRQVKGAGMQAFTFGQSKARIIDPNDTRQKVTFKDVAGLKEAKEELVEIVDFLKNPKKFLEIGARIPKGVLLVGAPGTGKTLLARAVAGEAKVPFLYLSGSEFVEMFVGVGASRVRDLFKMAKRIAPSIIFIDEIDAVGRHRGSGIGGGNDEREQTLNQILVELDGFEPAEKVIVMAATNRPDVLDPALLRPGRFDRRVVLDLPDIKERQEILKIHAAQKPLGEDVDLLVIAQRTPGFAGADLANLVNEAAILAARESRRQVSQYDLIRSIEKVMLGPERKSRVITEHEKKITAYHEMGHALLSSILPYADPVHKVTIISRGRAGGYTLKLPLEEKRLRSKKEFLDDIVVSLGGYIAEQIIFGDITTGASNDIAVATALARGMVAKYGMSNKVGPVSLDEEGRDILTGRPGIYEKNFSDEMAALVDREVSKIMNDASRKARHVLTARKEVLQNMAEELFKIETLEREEFEKLLIVNGIRPKRLEEGTKGVTIEG